MGKYALIWRDGPRSSICNVVFHTKHKTILECKRVSWITWMMSERVFSCHLDFSKPEQEEDYQHEHPHTNQWKTKHQLWGYSWTPNLPNRYCLESFHRRAIVPKFNGAARFVDKETTPSTIGSTREWGQNCMLLFKPWETTLPRVKEVAALDFSQKVTCRNLKLEDIAWKTAQVKRKAAGIAMENNIVFPAKHCDRMASLKVLNLSFFYPPGG